MTARLRTIMLDRGGLLALVTLVLYSWVAPPHIVDGDNAEFATLGTIGGTAHPTGYPLYLLWLRAMSWLPGESPAHTTAIATAIIGAASVLVLQAACRAWGAKPLAATIAAAIYAGAPISIRIGCRAEVFALNCLVVAVVLWLSAQNGPLRGMRRAAVLGLVAGLGMSNHMTCTLIAPVGILGVVRGVREASRPAWATIASTLAGFVVGLLPYAYLLATPETPLSWGKVSDLHDLYAMVTREAYGGPSAFLLTGKEVPASTQLVALGMTLGRAWLWVPLALGFYAVGRGIARSTEGETRWAWALLAIAWLLAGPALAMRFNIEPAAMGLYVIQRFHQLPVMLMTVPVAVGLSALAPYVARARLSQRAAIGIVSTLGMLAIAGLSLPHLQRIHTPAVERYAQNVLHSLPQHAVLIAGEDDQYFGTGYVQYALGERTDVTLLAFQLTTSPWYARRMEARGIFAPEGDGPVIVRIVDYLLSKGRPVFIERQGSATSIEIVRAFPTYPYGPVMKVLPRGAKPPSLDDVLAENKAIFAKFRIDYPIPGDDDEFATMIHHRYAGPWNALARKLEAAGKRDDAAWALAAAKAIGPQSP